MQAFSRDFFLLFLASAAVSSGTGGESHLKCPASSLIHRENIAKNLSEIYFTYPIDIFSQNLGKSFAVNGNLYKCESPEKGGQHSAHTCSTESYFCPLDGVDTSVAVVLDNTHPITVRNKVINIIVFGGSVTKGVASGGCCCSEAVDDNCKSHNSPSCAANSDTRDPASACSWPHYFDRYLQSLSSDYVVHNLAKGGYKTQAMGLELPSILRRNKIVLTANDVVFIDHSVNDAASLTSDEELKRFDSGVELFIRQLLIYSGEARPNIIFLEMFPFPEKEFIDSYIYGNTSSFDYSNSYFSLAAYYNLSIWSYKSLIWSKQNPLEFPALMSSMIPYLRFHNNYVDKYTRMNRCHPPWYVSLFYADLIGSLFFSTFEKQRARISTNTDISSAATVKGSFALPPPVNTVVQISCDDAIPSLLDIDFTSHTNSMPLSATVTPIHSWVHIEDRPKKYGLVSQFKDRNSRLSPHELVVFLPNITSNIGADEELTLMLTYLRTYRNAGALEIDICNTFVYIIDALWTLFDDTLISVPETFSTKFTPRQIRHYCKNEPEPYFRFHHYFHKSRNPAENIARTDSQKFRIDRVVVCVPVAVAVALSDSVHN